jgi:hypothetical protein
MTEHTLKEHVSQPVKLTHYQNGELWYVCGTGFAFPVPITDTNEARFMAEDKGLFFMRWIKAHMEATRHAKAMQSQG